MYTVWIGFIDGRTLNFDFTKDELENFIKAHKRYKTTRLDGYSLYEDEKTHISLDMITYLYLPTEEELDASDNADTTKY